MNQKGPNIAASVQARLSQASRESRLSPQDLQGGRHSSAGSHGLQHGFGRLRSHAQQHARRVAGFAPALFPLVKGSHADAQQAGELVLAQAQFLSGLHSLPLVPGIGTSLAELPSLHRPPLESTAPVRDKFP